MDKSPLQRDCWRVTWGLDVFSHADPIPVLDAPDVTCFRFAFPDQATAIHFKTEIQRYLGDLLTRLADKGADALTGLRTEKP
ncbi:MAG TPA: hypothetical protein VF909_16700 [Roseiflexaceae bacterium]